MAGLTLVRVHEPDAVREIMKEAHAIANELAVLGAEYHVVLPKAADLLAARIPLMQQPSLDLAGLNLGPRL